jgi:SAM-dependent methyltransferase
MSEFDEAYYLAANPDVAMAVRAGLCRDGREHYERFGKTEGRSENPEAGRAANTPTKGHRRIVVDVVAGSGIEIGAFDSPCPVGDDVRVRYCDTWSAEQARQMFPELSSVDLQEPDVIVDLDREGLRPIGDESQDFVIMNHVIEHVANPIRCIEEIIRVLRPGGHLVIAAPDKRYTMDRARAITGWPHLLAEYRAGVTEVDPLHFVDMVALLRPDVVALGVDSIRAHVSLLRQRREHAHVWDSEAFRTFLEHCAALLGVNFRFVFEAAGDETGFEYFAIVEITDGRPSSSGDPP